jgi:RNA polymerase sigma factor (sigma-70 family)
MKAVLKHDALVIKIVNKYKNFANLYSNVLVEDLFQVGRLEVFRKLPDYDKTKSSEVTYFYIRINQAIRRYLKHQQLVKLNRTDKLRLSETITNNIEFDDIKNKSIESPENILDGMQQAEIAVKCYLKRIEKLRSRPQPKRELIASLIE